MELNERMVRERAEEEARLLGGLGSLASLRRKARPAPVIERRPEPMPIREEPVKVAEVKPDPMAADDDMMRYGNAIAKIESRGQPNEGYGAVGPDTGKGNRAYGRYQVMDFNIGPWTKEALGSSLTPQEFLANREAQDAVFKLKFGQSLAKYGNPRDAASVWFTGQPLARGRGLADVNKMTGSRYVDLFDRGLYAGGGLVGWIKRQFDDEPQNPERSWDMDPPVSQYTSDEEAREARLYKVRHGNPNEHDIHAGTRISREETAGDELANRWNTLDMFYRPAKEKQLGWDRADRVYATQMDANKSPISALGFDPSRISTSDNSNINMKGGYFPKTDRIWAALSIPGNVAHESMHRGQYKIMNDPEGAKLMKDEDLETHVRANMMRTFGPSAEAEPIRHSRNYGYLGHNPHIEKAKQILSDKSYQKKLRAIDRVAHRLLAEEIIARQGGVR